MNLTFLQDGGQFYLNAPHLSEPIIVETPFRVLHDDDMEGTNIAREYFLNVFCRDFDINPKDEGL